jgi:hypothetical protein
MLETLITLLGGGLGGLLRLAPEFMRLLDRKNERAHEASMFDKQLEADKLRSDLRIGEANAAGQIAIDQAGLAALVEGVKAQAVQTGVRWVDGLSALMRPLITLQWVILLWPAVIVSSLYGLVVGGAPIWEAVPQVFGTEEKGICSSIIGFWFVDRALRHRRV